ncbi:DUF72 domain-containing protein [Ramlibacter albus]|uniref:DUF72 domain-containing protein n=1 Tax=Ramlibacter albus TaxID=2079448 RepID=A0A923MA44_9BURK|nr:DUF72 domain-containing protein [Ramlibacter albus]
MEGNILTGSASWTDKTLIACGRFYPKEAKTAEARLRYYASQFPMVEVDSSYYALPSASNSQLWVERTPPGFVFNVKAFRAFTGHAFDPQVLPKDMQLALGSTKRSMDLEDLPREMQDELWRRFIEALAPLKAAGKLGAVHFQFSPRMRDKGWVEHCVQRMEGHLLSAEFRHRSWFEGDAIEDTIAMERDLGLVHTVVDSPQGFANCVPCVWEVTNPQLALVRLHGRNRETWNITHAKASSSRFDYWYSADELEAMVPEIEHLATQARQVHVVFNTNNEDQGQVNARLMRQLLQSGNRRRLDSRQV